MKNDLTFHFKIPRNAGLEKFLKNSSQCWNIFIDTTSNIFSIVGGGVKWKIPHNVRFLPGGIEKFLKNSSQCWIHPGKNPTLWGIFVKLELNHRWDQRQRSQWCPQKLQRFQKNNFVRNTWKMVSFSILKFLTMLCLISFWKIPHNVGFIQVKIQPFWHHLQFF